MLMIFVVPKGYKSTTYRPATATSTTGLASGEVTGAGVQVTKGARLVCV